MAGINDYSNTAGSNITINGIDIAEGCSPAGINNAIRQLMADIADVDDGVVALQTPDINGGTIDGAVIGGTTPAAGTFTNLTATGTLTGILGNVSEDSTPQLGGSLDLNSNNITGTGNIDITGSIDADELNVAGTSALRVNTSRVSVDVTGSASAPSLIFNGDSNTGIFRVASDTLGFSTFATERMRLDSSGNLLVGKTSTDLGTAGTALLPSGVSFFTRDGDKVLRVNRLTSDGDIIDLLKDGTTVGSIGTQGGTLEIGSGDVYLQFNGANDWIKPVDGSGNNKSGVDLGTSGAQFDNLYLGGNIYLGGTGSANALDDYETGTWTASYGTSGTDTGYYTKVGRLVTLNIVLDATSQTFDQVTGLPFSSDLATGAVTFGRILNVGAGKDRSNVGGNTSGTTLFLYNENATSSSLTTGGGTVRLDITVTYLTNS